MATQTLDIKKKMSKLEKENSELKARWVSHEEWIERPSKEDSENTQK
jgi:hypothetical protein